MLKELIKKFRKKPVIIESVQWDGTNGEVIKEFVKSDYTENGNELIIHTLEGDMTASLGDWIIKGVKGEFYPCKPDIFENTYEEVFD